MNRIIALSGFIALTSVIACGEPEPEADPPCDFNSVEDVFPADGVNNAYYRTSVEVRLDDADADATIEIDGVSGTVEVVDDRVIFTPDDVLDSSTEYTMTTTYTGEDGSACPVETTFTTSEVGAAIGTVSDLVGNSYDLDLESGRFVQPEGIGSLLGKYLGDVTIYLAVESASDTKIKMVGALADETTVTQQDHCSPTIDFPEADFANPYFEVDATGQTTSFTVSGITVDIDDLVVSGAFSPDGTYIAGGVLAGSIDTRPLVDLVEEGGEPDAICELAGSIGVDCEECPDGEMLCLSLYVDNLAAPQATSTTITPQTETEMCATYGANVGDECYDDCNAA
ncbi:MAG: hypothetical protein KC912_09740 [Proteobacteria bacterium]|nr:hypothetical protein [Pseudomonadota bacterium]